MEDNEDLGGASPAPNVLQKPLDDLGHSLPWRNRGNGASQAFDDD